MPRAEAAPQKFHMRLPPEARQIVDRLQALEEDETGYTTQRGELVLKILKAELERKQA